MTPISAYFRNAKNMPHQDTNPKFNTDNKAAKLQHTRGVQATV